jgi:hypothetical protein
MIVRIATILLIPMLLCQEAAAVGFYHAYIETIRGKMVAIDTKTGFLVDGYIIEVEEGSDGEALTKIRKALISNTRHEYRKFDRPRSGQILVLVRKTDKVKVGVGDSVEIRGYGVVNHSESGPRDGNPTFKSFLKIEPVK